MYRKLIKLERSTETLTVRLSQPTTQTKLLRPSETVSIETVLLWIYPVILVFHLYDGYNIAHTAFKPMIGSIITIEFEPQFIESMMLILIASFPLITQFKRGLFKYI